MARSLLSLVTAPTGPGLADRYVEEHLRLEGLGVDAGYLRALELAAVGYVEGHTGRQLLTATYTLTLPCFPADAVIVVPKPPLQSVTSIAYLDGSGVSQTWPTSNYRVHAPRGDFAAHGEISLASGVSWPSTRDVRDAVTITFVAGYGEVEALPASVSLALMILLSHWYEHREPIVMTSGSSAVQHVPLSVSALLRPFRIEAGRAA